VRSHSSFEHAGLSIEIDQDPAPESPREAIDRLGHLVFWHPAILLGDEPPLVAGATAEAVANDRAAKLWLPIWVTEGNSAVQLRIGSGVDLQSGPADGLIYATGPEIKRRIKLFRLSRRALLEAYAILQREVEDYEQWLRRELLQFAIHDQAGVLVERQGGFGSLAHARAAAIGAAEHHAALLSRYAPERLSYRVSTRER
jgi:hypothetical protein